MYIAKENETAVRHRAKRAYKSIESMLGNLTDTRRIHLSPHRA
jgi:hypothetical protein